VYLAFQQLWPVLIFLVLVFALGGLGNYVWRKSWAVALAWLLAGH
jgi:hypothetical protein